jgi:rare lipoprotein A (peptidoglycan hydrolase)
MRSVVVAVVAAIALLTPAFVASAYVGEPSDPAREPRVLSPVPEPEKTGDVREPSGLAVAEASEERKPTRIRRVTATTATRVSLSSSAPVGDGWQRARVSWYGPGFYGNTMAGGGTLQPDSMVVAHRSMAFGTRIEFSYKGRTCIAVVMDRGPYAGGRTFDLGPGTAKALGFSGVGTVEYRIVR